MIANNIWCKPEPYTKPGPGTLEVTKIPSDKSISHRILMFAMLEKGLTVVENVNISGAITPLLEAMKELGVEVLVEGKTVKVGYLQRNSKNRINVPYLQFGSSSAAARLIIGLLSGWGVHAIVDGDETLRPRPFDWVVDPLRELGADIEYLKEEGQLPVRIKPSILSSGKVSLTVGSAQALSAVLYGAFASEINVEVEQKVRARDHTQHLLTALGGVVIENEESVKYQFREPKHIGHYRVPADPSAIAYPLTAHFLSGKLQPVIFRSVCLNPTRTGYFELLKRSGLQVEYSNVSVYWGEKVGDVILNPEGKLQPLKLDSSYDFHAMIDEVPLSILLATQITGTSEFHGLGELTFKETNRITASGKMVNAFGAEITIKGFSVTVVGKQKLNNNVCVPSFGDHRLAMSAATVASGLGMTVEIEEGKCYETSFSQFDSCFAELGFLIQADSVKEDEYEAAIG